MLKTYRIIPLVFILFLFGFTLFTVAPVFAQGQHASCTLENLKFIATTNRPPEYKERYVREYFNRCIDPDTRGQGYGEGEATAAERRALEDRRDACRDVKDHMAVVRRDGLHIGETLAPELRLGSIDPESSPVARPWLVEVVLHGAGGCYRPNYQGRNDCLAGVNFALNRLTGFIIASDELIFNIVDPVLCGDG